MAAGTLYTYPVNFRAQKILVAAQYSGANIKVVSEAPAFKLGETNKTDEFLKKFPLGKVPAFETSSGLTLFESNAIAYYVSSDSLRGANLTNAAYIQQWVNFSDNEILPAACTWVFPCLGIMQYNKQNTERAKEDIKRALSVLNKNLESRTFLVGERISLADISVGLNLLSLYKMVFDAEFRKQYQNVNRWFITFINQPQVKAVIGEVKLMPRNIRNYKEPKRKIPRKTKRKNRINPRNKNQRKKSKRNPKERYQERQKGKTG